MGPAVRIRLPPAKSQANFQTPASHALLAKIIAEQKNGLSQGHTHGGRPIKNTGNVLLAEFPGVLGTVRLGHDDLAGILDVIRRVREHFVYGNDPAYQPSTLNYQLTWQP